MTKLTDKIKGCFAGKNIGGTLGMYFEGAEEFLDIKYYDPIPDKPVPNDDLDLQIIWLEYVKKFGTDLTNSELAEAWKNHIDGHPDEYGIALWNIKRGLKPPLTGIHNNFFTHGMGAAIRAEIWAALFPGKPLTSAYYAYHDASVDHWNEGVTSEMFLAAFESPGLVLDRKYKYKNLQFQTFHSIYAEFITV